MHCYVCLLLLLAPALPTFDLVHYLADLLQHVGRHVCGCQLWLRVVELHQDGIGQLAAAACSGAQLPQPGLDAGNK